MHADNHLYNELNTTKSNLDTQIEMVKTLAEARGVSWLAMQDRNGNMVATPLLVARAHVLQAMTAIKMGNKK